jgi:hypothetical protein
MACCSNAEEEVSEDAYVQLQGGLLGTKRKAVTTHAELQSTRTEIQDKQDHGMKKYQLPIAAVGE